MSQDDGDEPLTTHVGRISPSELHFRGYEVEELLGRNYWQLVSLSLAGPQLNASACETLDRLSTCMLACDPRIWPLKLVQLAACHGSISSGLGVGLVGLETSPISYWTAGPAARFLRELMSDLKGRPLRTDSEVLEGQGVPPGFGVHGREVDQRVILFRRWRQTSSTSAGAFERLALDLEPWVVSQYAQRMHIDGLAGAVLSDLGFAPDQVAVMSGVVHALPNLLANAHEGSQRGPELRTIASAKISYTGHAPRCSNRSRVTARERPGWRDPGTP
jgi:hypothetical protein